MSYFDNEKLDRERLLSKEPTLVEPVTQPRPRVKRSTRFRGLLISILALSSVYYLTHHTFRGHGHDVKVKGECAMKNADTAWAFSALGEGKGPANLPLRGKAAEELFLTVPNEGSCILASRLYATKPHIAGSEGDLQTARDFLALLQKELGVEPPVDQPIFPAGSEFSRNATLGITNLTEPTAWIDVYYPVQNLPVSHSLEILDADGNAVWEADLEEQSDGTDPEATEYRTAVPIFHGLSKDGEATGKLIYVNYGRKSDYDDLVAKGVDFTGAIVLARYGGVFRGLKVKGAEELGAAGILIYSDPRDDGTVTEENGYVAYPHGPARNPTSVQRGSVQYLSMYPGDPTTPGYPAYENATRTEGTNIPGIPSLPISWATAKVLLEELEGDNRQVKMVNHVDNKVTPIWNPMGVIPGHIKDEVIIVGNHRDAWVMGAADPSSGTASVNEVIRGVGVLLKNGWKPLRTIVFASWDSEEYGLIGSTEWGEDFADWIQQHVVAYFNLDSSTGGSAYGASGSPSFSHFIRESAKAIQHPTDPERTLWDARSDKGPLFGEHIDANFLAMHEEVEANNVRDEIGVSPLGSGSDFTVFLQRLGIASLNFGFSGTLSDPVYHYHSIFDSERWQELYSDPGFVKHVAVAKHLGLQTIRLADAIILPINTTHYAFELEKYLDSVEALAEASSLSVNFTPLRASIKELQFASVKLDHEKYHAEKFFKKALKSLKWWRHHHHKPGFFGSMLHKCKAMLGFAPKHHHEHGEPHGEAHHRHEHKHIEAGEHHEHKHHHEHHHMPPQKGMLAHFVHKCKAMLGFKVGKVHVEAGHAKEHVKPKQHMPAHRHHEHEEDESKRVERRRHHHHEHDIEAHDEHHDAGFPHPKLPWPLNPKKALVKAAKAVRKVNKKLASFEQGFISEGGIKDREWYRHLGVAPGKWLGYGATTLPALTESITIEKNATMAADEAKRLEELIDKMTDLLKA